MKLPERGVTRMYQPFINRGWRRKLKQDRERKGGRVRKALEWELRGFIAVLFVACLRVCVLSGAPNLR